MPVRILDVLITFKESQMDGLLIFLHNLINPRQLKPKIDFSSVTCVLAATRERRDARLSAPFADYTVRYATFELTCDQAPQGRGGGLIAGYV